MLLKKYKNLTIPKSLEKLIEFSSNYEDFSESFYLNEENDKSIFETYSQDEVFLKSLINIGSADGTGSEYAFWLKNGEDITDTPIVVFGSEGGYFVIAQNFNELIKILSFDCEPSVDFDEVYFCKDEDIESDNITVFREWITNELDIKPVFKEKKITKIVQKAGNKYQEEFEEWINKFEQPESLEEDDENYEDDSYEELLEEYKETFNNYDIPETLHKLMLFEKEIEYEYITGTLFLNTCSNYFDIGDNKILESLFIFATTDDEEYAFWVNENVIDLEHSPIVLIRNENSLEIIAKNIQELLKLLSVNPNAKFKKWINEEFDIKSIDFVEFEDLVSKAKLVYEKPFQKWLNR